MSAQSDTWTVVSDAARLRELERPDMTLEELEAYCGAAYADKLYG